MQNPLVSLWAWFAHFRFINQQVITDLYTEHVDDLNNVLQCNNCGSISAPDEVICPDCNQPGHCEMVCVPDIDEDERTSSVCTEAPVCSITPDEYTWVVKGRERMRAQQAWNEAVENHDPESCNESDCEMCVEIEHDRMIRDGEI